MPVEWKMETSVLFIRKSIRQNDKISEEKMCTVAVKITISKLMPYMADEGP
jgi:hypothetical protein